MDKYFKNLRVTQEKEVPWGVYVWEMPDGRYLADGPGYLLSVDSAEGDIQKMAALTRVVRSYGIEEGKPAYLSGARKVTDGEHDSMMERMEEGFVPDPADPGNWSGDV